MGSQSVKIPGESTESSPTEITYVFPGLFLISSSGCILTHLERQRRETASARSSNGGSEVPERAYGNWIDDEAPVILRTRGELRSSLLRWEALSYFKIQTVHAF